MYPHSFLWHYLWLAPHVLQIVVVVAMIRRRLVRDFSVFFTYTAFEIVQGTTLFVLDHNPAVSAEQYWHAHWIGLTVSVALRSAIIYEILVHVFRPYPAIEQLGRAAFRWSAAFLVLAAVGVAARAPWDDPNRILSGIHVVSVAVSVVQCGLLLFIYVFSSYFGLSWRNYVFGIAVGMGIFSFVNLAIASIEILTWASAGSYILDFVTMATYHCSVLVWLWYSLAREPAHYTVKDLPKSDLEKWNAALQRFLLQ
jgi:hypothetical protein